MKFLRAIFFFGFAGTLGFLTDTGVLYLLRGALGPWMARVCSFLAAVFVTWLINRRLTFRDRSSRLPVRQEFAAYLMLMLIGGAVNYGIYAWMMVSYELVMQQPVWGVAGGSVTGMAVNLLCSQFLLFRHSIKQKSAGGQYPYK